MEVTEVLVGYGEIALKGRNRPRFVRKLRENIQRALRGLSVADVRAVPGRLRIRANEGHPFDFERDIKPRLARVFGIVNFSPVVRCTHDFEDMQRTALNLLTPLTFNTFRLSVRRSDKSLPFRSTEVTPVIAGHILEQFKQAGDSKRVQLKGADIDLVVEIAAHDTTYMSVAKHRGPGGLPVGITGKVCVLLSGGIDSPVAAARVLKRGCQAMFVHFHGHPFVTRASLEKAEELCEVLAPLQGGATLKAVAFGNIQRTIVARAPEDLRIILYRRLMLRIAGAIARQHGCKVLVTGEALAQVASQTLANMTVIGEASPLPVLRPLVAYDKQEIIDEARALGTFEISIQPDQDCCTLFTPKHPQTHARLHEVHKAEEALDIPALVAEAQSAANLETMTIAAEWTRGRTP